MGIDRLMDNNPEKPTEPCPTCKIIAWYLPEEYFGKKVWLCGICHGSVLINPNKAKEDIENGN